ncbi:hypothetical protein SVIO_078080 [Streptomyces violaceusniger]|uniref:Uncharacterized protein n=1 Tax=Streptomyces violaceusniger TaxID=68280 RepID=A0A4D4L7W2_STRVO|nr:hypothetical protein SVIO_078080 [Streptomyces violaceusniger]
MRPQRLLQPAERRAVEVVRRLVQQHHLGGGRDQTGEPEPGLLTARQTAEPPLVPDAAEPQAVQGLLHPGIRLIAAAGLERGEQIAVRGEHVGGAATEIRLQLAQPALHGAHLGEGGVHRVAHRVVRRQLGGLAEVADTAVGHRHHGAVVR